jgi:hypothetical protein
VFLRKNLPEKLARGLLGKGSPARSGAGETGESAMQESFRAVLAGALMLAAAPAAANFDQLYLEGDYVMWDQPPPVPVGRVDDPNWFEKLPTELQSELLRDLIMSAFGGSSPLPMPTSLIEVPEGRIGVQVGGPEFNTVDPRTKLWLIFFFQEVGNGIKFVIDFLAGQPGPIVTNGNLKWEGNTAEVISYQPFIIVMTPPQPFDSDRNPSGHHISAAGRPADEPVDPIDKPSVVPSWAPSLVSLSGGDAPILRMAIFLETPRAAAPVPEPQAWAMMIAGFGLVGSALRSRRRRAVCA